MNKHIPIRFRIQRLYKWYFLFLVWILLSSTAGCALLPMVNKNQQPSNLGKVSISADLGNVRAAEITDCSVTLTLSKDGRSKTQLVPIVNSSITVVLDGILPGIWDVMLQITDISNTITYQAKGKVTVLPGVTANLQLVLRPLPGMLEVSVDPASHPELTAAKRGRLYINPGGYSSMSVNESNLLIGTKELAPGTYDFNVVLYSESYYASDKLYESPWNTVTIQPGRTTRVTWNPVTGICTIGGRVDAQPFPPANVQLNKTLQGLIISWDPVPNPEADLASYRIYVRQNVLDKFDLVYEATASKGSYTYPASELESGTHIEVVVTAVDIGGQESDRSIVATINY